jgi:hypothetical protein
VRVKKDLYMQNSGHLSADRWRTHYARTNYCVFNYLGLQMA